MKIIQAITGVDEVGRGPIAGPVVAAAVILKSNHQLSLKDSKKLTSKQRENLLKHIKKGTIDFKICSVSAKKIDQINILQASLLAMKKAIEGLKKRSSKILIDGNQTPNFDELNFFGTQIQSVIKGDNFEPSIQAAAILAKVYRDCLMTKLDRVYPEYGFKNHKGYPTPEHKKAIEKYGAIAKIHRFSFAPIKHNPQLIIRS